MASAWRSPDSLLISWPDGLSPDWLNVLDITVWSLSIRSSIVMVLASDSSNGNFDDQCQLCQPSVHFFQHLFIVVSNAKATNTLPGTRGMTFCKALVTE